MKRLLAWLAARLSIQRKDAAPKYTGSFLVDDGNVQVKKSGVVYGQWDTSGLNFRRDVNIITTDVTMLASQSGAVYSNKGAGAAVTITLPAAVAGLTVTVFVAAAQLVYIDPATGDQIAVLTNAAGDRISNNVAGSYITLVAIDGTDWVNVGSGGTWADAN